MAKAGAIDVPDAPVDLTEELPLDDENVLAGEEASVWRRYRWPIVGRRGRLDRWRPSASPSG